MSTKDRLAALARRRVALRTAHRWAPAFGCDPARCDLSGYELIVLDGVGESARDQLRVAKLLPPLQRHALVLGYLSLGTVEAWRPYASQVPDAWTIGAVDDWPGERYADVRERGWRELMTEQAITLSARGFDGLYLDNLDVAEDHPPLADALVALVRGLREAAPELLLVAQNGLAVDERLPIDAVAHEDVFWRWEDGYRRSPPAETEQLLRGLRRLHARGLPVFTLDYAEPGSAGAADAVRRSLQEGFHPAVSVLELDRPPHLAEPARSVV
ncbi:endo alpha-1,4 polygalactosaminidase [Conexibacter sp. CPCC 206217]|uniref:endo alpha-1,4 polygalactosaminidase n=1 Tax=Conexibacter sp. CPCC 206217 TaxID=3064574 RepID=UPI0027290EDE|nr:endo alpha-1,4 polygalactosaminidase [Conexibacter sp. CPCC 206217]MDO8212485.1 endo alpha-1,4 polygalactosaminidase [Conexibacter sp. CPCC 206217]